MGDEDARARRGRARCSRRSRRTVPRTSASRADERLVEQQRPRARRQRAGQRHPLRLAAGQRRRRGRRAGRRGPARSSHSTARARAVGRARPPARRPKATLSATSSVGNSSRSWNTTPIDRSSGATKVPAPGRRAPGRRARCGPPSSGSRPRRPAEQAWSCRRRSGRGPPASRPARRRGRRRARGRRPAARPAIVSAVMARPASGRGARPAPPRTRPAARGSGGWPRARRCRGRR